MLISEIYQSRQGEGRLTGTPSVFVRTSGCNLRCGFCDTPFASWSPEGQTMAPVEVLAQAQAVADGAAHVVITGGEPMLPKEITELCRLFRDADFHITIETAGTIDRKLDCDLMSISPKLANSDPTLERAGRWLKKHQLTRHQPEIVSSLIASYPYQLKFVVDSESDVGEIDAYLKTLTCQLDTSRVLLMPQGVEQTELQSREQWLEPICQQRGYTLCRRMHILWYGNQRGT